MIQEFTRCLLTSLETADFPILKSMMPRSSRTATFCSPIFINNFIVFRLFLEEFVTIYIELHPHCPGITGRPYWLLVHMVLDELPESADM